MTKLDKGEKSSSTSASENTHRVMVVESQGYPLGDKTPSTSVEDTAQYVPYKYPFKDESEG